MPFWCSNLGSIYLQSFFGARRGTKILQGSIFKTDVFNGQASEVYSLKRLELISWNIRHEISWCNPDSMEFDNFISLPLKQTHWTWKIHWKCNSDMLRTVWANVRPRKKTSFPVLQDDMRNRLQSQAKPRQQEQVFWSENGMVKQLASCVAET